MAEKGKALQPRVVKLIDLLQKKKVKPESLGYPERRKIIQYFLEEQSEVSNRQIAELIGTTRQAVGQMKKTLIKNAAWEIDELDLKLLASSLKVKKEEYQRKAVKKGDLTLAWKIEMEFIEKMQSFGYVHKEAEKVGYFNQALSINAYRESKRLYSKENGKTK